MDDFWVWDFDVLQFCLAIHEEFMRYYLVPCRGAVWGTPLSRYCHVVKGVWYIYDWDTGSLILIWWEVSTGFASMLLHSMI